MADKKKIEDIIKESFEGQQFKAPKGMWENVSHDLNSPLSEPSFDKKIKESFEGRDIKAPDQAWKGVKQQLNIDRTWNKVKHALDVRTTRRYIKRYTAAAILLLFALETGYYLFKNKQPDNLAETESKTLNEPGTDYSYDPDIKDQGNTDKYNAELPGNDQSGVLSKDRVNNKVIKRDSGSGKKKSLQEVEKRNNTPIPFAASTQKLPLLSGKVSGYIIDLIPSAAQIADSLFQRSLRSEGQKFEIGVIYAYNQTRLINNETRKSNEKESLIYSPSDFAGSFGIIAGYNFTDKNAIKAFVFLNSRILQRYKTYLEGKYVTKEITLDYGKLSLSYQHSFFHKRIPFASLKYIIQPGIYASYLKQSRLSFNIIDQELSSSYTSFDYGLSMRVGQELQKGRFLFSYGINAEKGFRNIFGGEGKIPADFDRTFARQIGGFASLRYKF